ncbi:uncharacterized protein LAESUDRAFT_719689 [Laetiporus sulphureus 93-53]|uniref:Uncharacterized protein n=1 Tax=Laetiporus sulphureus 93-53 TaxID=1314785 RepID=A0A165HHM2_9APHY|nr:uncharacterized protein LAESUDRAFT_719689 [Laetiporus sulphureus 93-53]KZT11744.1 hypothetical protein LAESUDRAFT_719689 [Laetiporus sulphureus 93-53]
MRWTAQGFYKDIVLKHKLVLDGWPANVIFTNPSGIRGGIHVFDDLRNRMEKGVLKFRAISNGEAAKLDAVSAAPGPIPPPILRPGRCDIGKHRYRPITNPYDLPRRRVGMGPRSPPFVLDADLEDEGVADVEQYPETAGSECSGGRSMDLDDIEEFSV